MSRFVAAAVAAATAFAVGVVPTKTAHADTQSPADMARRAETAMSCEITASLTPARARDGRASRHEILWNPVDASEVVRGDDAIALRLEGAGGILRGERAYPLTAIEFLPRADSRRYPVEARFIHQRAGGDQVIVGLYLTEGDANPALEPLLAAAAAADGAALDGVDPRTLLPGGDARLVFADRTDRGCAPRVIWTVLDAPLEASREQLASLGMHREHASLSAAD